MILLGFDLEEFDLPIELGNAISFDEQLTISTYGNTALLALLKEFSVKATFYCTANYAIHKPEVIKQIIMEGHEIASHGYFHSAFVKEHLLQSRLKLQEIAGVPVTGFRMPRMMPVDEQEIADAVYTYNSSLNPTWLPGRYNNFDQPRTWFYKNGVLQLPASVSPGLRIPLFWLSFHNLPMWLLKTLSASTLKKDGYLNLYFHPWEFFNLETKPQYGLPSYIVRNSGNNLLQRLRGFITWAKSKGYTFERTADFVGKVSR
ncbi:DUF3473 domain-containing protein [Mucilaginibacter conchicola]|uniref:DUF3473 domain-containing protein n=1 Tax=Mucilaginibacter conchicola TaxID=2303333 RepID=A0A372NMX2_9SPHI|nr:polysaccharide deacetylase family protein [Mucilaginibacter conchicola]RFZ90296.1 DUF3473 domain-containing protein [Mucilaginibacter conchicola]